MRIQALYGRAQQKEVDAPDVYRITLPFTYLDNNGVKAGWLRMDQAQAMLRANGAALHHNLEAIFANDIIVLRRRLGESPEAGRAMYRDIKDFSKELTGKEAVIVYESDDDYSGRHRPAAPTPATWRPYIEHADAVIASTEPLGRLMAEEAGLDKYYVVRNYLPRTFFNEVSMAAPREDKRLTIMLAGTPTHDRDWRVAAEAIERVLVRHPEVSFKVAGGIPEYLRGKCEYIPPVLFAEYPGLLRQADILCCSLDPNDKFNDSKSWIKVLEGWSAMRPVGKKRTGGCAIIATKGATSYKGLINHRHDGLYAEHTPEAWERALELLIEDRFLRQKLQVNGLKRSKEYDIASNWIKWYNVFKSILASQRGG